MSPKHANPTVTDAPAAAPGAVTAVDPRLLVREQGFKGYLTEFKRKTRSGELGSIPVILGVLIIWAIFQSLDSSFLGAENLSKLSINLAGTGLIAVGIVFVLLLGEIDLSVGSVSGLAAAVFAVLAVNDGMNEIVAALGALATGAVIGALHGFFFAKIGVPAFVVTLAGLLGWNGLMLQVLGSKGTINLDSEGFLGNLSRHFFPQVIAAYGLAIAITALYFLTALRDSRRRKAAGIPSRPTNELVARTAVLAVLTLIPAYLFNQYKGLPLAFVIFLVVLIGADFVLRRTTYGRKIFAVGGSTEAASRAGINVAAIRISVYTIAGTMAAFGGLMLASKIAASNQGSGGGELLMNAIAAAVIGGTSLFGGRGSVWSALLGMLVIGSISSGMALLGVASAIQFMITGAVLLAAAVIDSISRRTQKSSGRA